MSRLLILTRRADLQAVVGEDDAFARYEVPDRIVGFACGRAVGYLRQPHGRPPTLQSFGPREDLDALLGALVADGHLAALKPGAVSVPFIHVGVLTRHIPVRGGGDWEWMWCSSSPERTATEARLEDLDDARDAEEITALAAVENPLFEGYPGLGRSERWLGVRDVDGALVACGARQRLASGTAHLAGILVAARARGQGLGRAISAALTREVVQSEGVATLGMYADNDVARTLYHSLGYRTDKVWATRIIVGADASATWSPHAP